MEVIESSNEMLDEERPRLEGELVGIPAANLSLTFLDRRKEKSLLPRERADGTRESGEKVITRRGRDLSILDPQCESSGVWSGNRVSNLRYNV